MDLTRQRPAKRWAGRSSVSSVPIAALRALVRLERQVFALQVSTRSVAAAAAALGLYALILYARADLTLVQGDAIGHLYTARRTIDSITPSFSQLGYIWLPLPHVLMLPLVWNDTLWRTGLAGSFVSLLAFALATAYLYRTVCALTGSGIAGVVGAALFATNPNLLFMQATPMGEVELLFFIIAASHHMVRWAQDGSPLHLLLSGAFVLGGTLSRYEAWWLVPVGVAVVAVVSIRRYGMGREVEGLTLTWAVLTSFGIVLWLLYNLVIFGDPLRFLHDIGSAQSFAKEQASAGVLPTKGDPIASARLFGWAVIDIAGLPLVLAGVGGFVALLTSRLSLGVKCATLIPASLFLFEVLSLTGAQSAMLSPHSSIPQFVNTRYGLLLLPALVITASMLARQLRLVGVALLLLVLVPQLMALPTPSGVDALQARTLSAAALPGYARRWADANYPILQKDEPATLVEAITVSGRSRQQIENEAAWIHDHAKGGRILISEHFHASALMLYSRLPLSRFIYDGNRPYFQNELRSPGRYTELIVYQPRVAADQIYALVPGGNPPGFQLAFDDGPVQVFRREIAVTVTDAPAPAAVPPWADRVTDDVMLGDVVDGIGPAQILQSIGCQDGVAALTTTRAILYAEFPCEQLPDAHAFLTLPVQLRMEPRGNATTVYIDAKTAGTLSFKTPRAWLAVREDWGESPPRPWNAPPTARLLNQKLSMGDEGDQSAFAHVLYAIRCSNDVVSVVTTKETLYTALGCDKLPDDHQFLTKTVHLAVQPGETTTVRLETAGLDPLEFTAGRSWLDSR